MDTVGDILIIVIESSIHKKGKSPGRFKAKTGCKGQILNYCHHAKRQYGLVRDGMHDFIIINFNFDLKFYMYF